MTVETSFTSVLIGLASFPPAEIERVLGPYVSTARISLNRGYLLSTVQVEEIGMYETHLGPSNRPKRV